MEEQNFGFLDPKIDFMALMDVLLNICRTKGTFVFTFLSLLLAWYASYLFLILICSLTFALLLWVPLMLPYYTGSQKFTHKNFSIYLVQLSYYIFSECTVRFWFQSSTRCSEYLGDKVHACIWDYMHTHNTYGVLLNYAYTSKYWSILAFSSVIFVFKLNKCDCEWCDLAS